MRFRWSGTTYPRYRNPQHESNAFRGKHMTNAQQAETAVYTSAARPRPKFAPSSLAKDVRIERNAEEREQRKRTKRKQQRAEVKAAKRVDAVVCLERVAQSLFKKHPHLQRQFITASTPIESVTMMMSIAKDSPAAVLMPQINQQLKMLITDGNIEKIIRRYD